MVGTILQIIEQAQARLFRVQAKIYAKSKKERPHDYITDTPKNVICLGYRPVRNTLMGVASQDLLKRSNPTFLPHTAQNLEERSYRCSCGSRCRTGRGGA